VFKLLEISIDYNNIFFYEYNKKCQKILDKYGDCKINNVYLVNQPINKLTVLLFNLLTFFKYNNYFNNSPENYPYHPAFIFEIKYKKDIKFLLLEKNNCINICESFLMNKSYDFKKIVTSKNKFTLNKILKKTQKRVGIHKFFNWNVYENNCQEFTKEILITLKKYNEKEQVLKDFIFRNKIKQFYSPSDLTVYTINCIFIIVNFFEKYIFDNNIFY
jgi:hypothetical protein